MFGLQDPDLDRISTVATCFSVYSVRRPVLVIIITEGGVLEDEST